jgi:cytochrome oxidase Cu insertion factor (SCO1/SenC/PrrC family)
MILEPPNRPHSRGPSMLRRVLLAVALVAVVPVLAILVIAQETTEPLEIGAVAPDFELPGGTRYGLLKDPVRLSDFRGKTVVLAFFYHSRTPG